MSSSSLKIHDKSVDDVSFWHISMDLFYGYQLGEVVEVEHESNKYWLATIEYFYRHLVLLKWVGNYGEFWVDTSLQNSSINFDEFNGPKRLFPPGYHLQSQLKSQFRLERPTKVLVKPSLYNPANDPYAEIETVDDLLTHEVNNDNDTFGNQSSGNSNEPASLVMAKCKTKIAFGQEDVDELEAALQNLNEIDSDSIKIQNGTPEALNITSSENINNVETGEDNNIEYKTSDVSVQAGITVKLETKEELKESSSQTSTDTSTRLIETKKILQDDHQANLELCKRLQESAMTRGRYIGVHEHEDNVYFVKPKQYFDVGGANHERVIVQGTLLEICHTIETKIGLELFHWFAIVLKNIGGRLTLRWFLCDEPKFKQGRLELKSCHSEFIREEDVETPDGNKDEEKSGLIPKTTMHVKDITFNMHFCNPCIHSISHAKSNHKRKYRMPAKLSSIIEMSLGQNDLPMVEKTQMDHIFDYRRMNLDKDRPIIDHLLSTVRWVTPQYLNIIFAPKDTESQREVLLSTPKTTKLMRGFIKRELEAGVYEVHSEPMFDSGEIIKFIFPYDSSYSILPTSWANHNQGCLSVNLSRNISPIFPEKLPKNETIEPQKTLNKESELNLAGAENHERLILEKIENLVEENERRMAYQPVTIEPFSFLCEIAKANDLKETDFTDMNPNIVMKPEDFDELEPSCWTRLMRAQELSATQFDCCLDYTKMLHVLTKFNDMDHLEVVHPSSDVTICSGRVRKVAYPLLWIQISADSYTVLPYNSTDIYPSRWCETNNHPLISLLPPRKRLSQQNSHIDAKQRKKLKNNDYKEQDIDLPSDPYEKEHFDLGSLNDKTLDIDYILNEKSMYIRIYFNHKCFTGPSLSKGKICSLPQYVGPGPLRLVMEEVVTKMISVAYVPPRILNDLSSKSFEDLLIARGLTNTAPMEFKAKYQKRVHRETIPVCLNPDDVTLYCECVCEHLKCCYNLFGPNLYDGDDCPGHCRALTKSNKFMKRATYYREKARLGEFTNENSGSKKSGISNSANKASRARYAGRDSSESTSSSLSRSEQVNSRASSAGEEIAGNELKENLVAVEEIENEDDPKDDINIKSIKQDIDYQVESTVNKEEGVEVEPEIDKILHSTEQVQNVPSIISRRASPKWCQNETEFNMFDSTDLRPGEWTVEDVAEHLDWCRLGKFKPHMVSEVS